MKDIESEIIESIRNGENNKALNYLYRDPLNKIRKYVLTNSGSMDDANDVFQDAVITFFHYVRTGKYKEEYDLDGFLYRVAKNAWIDKVRKNSKMVASFDHADFEEDADDNILAQLLSKEKLKFFHQIFDQLEENCKTILRYVLFEKKTMKEIKELLGYKHENVVKSQHYRCKQYFSKLLDKNEEIKNILKY